MKKLLKTFGFAGLAIVAGVTAAMAVNGQVGGAGNKGVCDLIKTFGGVFTTLRTLSFVGAAFVLAGWAWGFISKGDVKKEDLKDKGIGMMVGFVILFALGVIITALVNMAGPDGSLGCDKTAWGTWGAGF